MPSLSSSELANTGILFALILAAGFIAGKAGLLPKASQTGLTNIILCVTMPCTILNSFFAEYDLALLKSLVFVLLVATCTQGIGFATSLVFFRKQPHERNSVLRFGLIVCNCGFFGIPVLATVLGSSVLPLGSIFLIPQRFAMWLLGIPAYLGSKQKLSSVLVQTFLHPCMIAVYAGLSVMLTSVSLPAAITTSVSTLGLCTMPLAMLLVGSIFIEIKPSMLLEKNIYFYCLIRLVLIPGLVFLLCLLLGFGGDILRVSVLMAGMPAAAMTSLLAVRYDADERLASSLIVISTLLFFAMLPVWMTLFSFVP